MGDRRADDGELMSTLNRYDLGRECRVPPGARVVELKMCECCGNWFVRGNRDRVCRPCHAQYVPLVVVTDPEVEQLMSVEHPILQ